MSGMWSLIIYDKLENKFIISRDRFGIKPYITARLVQNIILPANKKF